MAYWKHDTEGEFSLCILLSQSSRFWWWLGLFTGQSSQSHLTIGWWMIVPWMAGVVVGTWASWIFGIGWVAGQHICHEIYTHSYHEIYTHSYMYACTSHIHVIILEYYLYATSTNRSTKTKYDIINDHCNLKFFTSKNDSFPGTWHHFTWWHHRGLWQRKWRAALLAWW